jgi:hypothetical protein
MSTQDEIRQLREEIDEVKSVLHEIQAELAKYRGFVGGCLWIVGAMFAAVKLVWPFLKDVLSIKGG